MRYWLSGVAMGALAGLFGVLVIASPLGELFERSVGLASLFKIRGPTEPPPDVAVIGINGTTGNELGLPSVPVQWPRLVHGELIEELMRRKVSLIAFDIHFAEAKNPADDRQFAKAIQNAGSVVLLEKLIARNQPLRDAQGNPRGSVWMESVGPPLAVLSAASIGLGPFPLPKLGASVHEFWAFKSSTGETPTLPAVALHRYVEGKHPDWRDSLAEAGIIDPDAQENGEESENGAEALRYQMQQLRAAALAPARESRSGAALATAHAGTATPGNALLRALVALYEKPGVRYLNLYGPPGTITTIPYQAIVRAGRDRSHHEELPDLRGKVVFVGYSDPQDAGQPDRFYTVFTGEDGVDLAGVEIAATSFANLLTDSSLNELSRPATLGLVGLFGLLAGMVVFLLPAFWGVSIALALAAAYGLVAQYGFNTSQLWLPVATPLLAQLPAAIFLGLFAQYFIERRRSNRVSAAISNYVPENIARELANNTFDPGSANKVVFGTCLATDMAGFSSIAEQLPPGELAAFLNDYFEGLSRPLRQYKVDVTEFRADAIMCAWTSSAPRLDVRRRAVLAALGAAAAITEFKERNPLISSRLRIGLESGWVYVGHAGGGGHFVYSIVGDSANTASRLENLNKHLGSQVLASAETVEGLDDILLRPLGRFQLLGKTESVGVVEILAIKAQATVYEVQRCEQFAAALARFMDADWAGAELLFATLLETHPTDGPAAFYHARCQRYRQDPGLIPADAGIILMTEK